MTDAEFDALKEKIQGLMEKWKAILPVGLWLVTPYYHREGGDLGRDCVARTTLDWSYLIADMDWNMPKAARLDDDYLETAVIHEYIHMLTDQIVRYAVKGEGYEGLYADRHQVEQTISMLALAVRMAYAAGQPS